MTALFYADDETYAVEVFDRVELRRDGQEFEGVIIHVHARAGEVTVKFADHRDTTRSGDPRPKTARVPIADVDFIARDG